MGKADRSSSKPSSSARAAEVLSSKTGVTGLSFGGYAGSTLVGPNVAGFGFGSSVADRLTTNSGPAEAIRGTDVAGGEVLLTMQVDGELAQCIRHLAKKDPITKTKALQNLRALVPTRSTADLLTAMPPWIFMYNRLIMDSSRAVRSETAATLVCLLKALGKAVAPHLKALLGPWFLAMHDAHGETAEASKSAFEAAFPAARRQLEVVLYCRTELMSYLKEQLVATPQQLGDAKKDSAEELEERHERVQAACLAALAAIITMMTSPPDAASGPADGSGSPASAAPAGTDYVLAAVRDIVCRPGFWKGTAGAKSAAVRRAAYGLARCAVQRVSGMLAEGCAAESAVCVLGALGEKEPGNHCSMWEAVLTYGKFCPDAWRHVSLRKMLLPRLYALLRHGCYGSAAVSLPALLPLLPLLPEGTLGPSPDVLVSVLEAVWTGMQDPSAGSRAAKSASLRAYQESLAWGLTSSERLAAQAPAAPAGTSAAVAPVACGDAASYCRALLQGTLARHVLPAALGSGAAAEAAREVVVGLAQVLVAVAERDRAREPAAESIPVACLAEAACQFVGAVLTKAVAAVAGASNSGGEVTAAESELAALCEGQAALLAQIRRDATGCPGLAAQVAAAAAQGLMSAGPSGLPPAASQLLATLLREYGSSAASAAVATAAAAGAAAEPREGLAAASDAPAATPGAGKVQPAIGGTGIGCGSFSLDSMVAAMKAGPLTSPATEATADLLVAFCSSHHDNASVLWEQVLAAVLPSAMADDDDDGTGSNSEGAEALQRSLLLLRRFGVAAARETAAAGGGVRGAGGGPMEQLEKDKQEGPIVWTSNSLDALAVRIARCCDGVAAVETPRQVRGHAAALLSAALGANAAGQVMLRPSAAAEVVRVLTEHLTAAASLGRGHGALSVQQVAAAADAADLAVSVLADSLCSGSGGLWQLLPDQACAATAALAQLAWQAPYSRSVGRVAGYTRHDSDEGYMTEGGSDEGASIDGAEDAEGASSSDEDNDAKDGCVEAADGAPKPVVARLVEMRSGAGRFWREGKPLLAAAETLPPARVDELVRQLARLLAACASAHPPRLSSRAWAAHAAQLLAAAPGRAVQRQAVLDTLLSARQAEWRAWSSLAARGSGLDAAAGPSTSGAGVASASNPDPSLEYLARLVVAAGPGAVLGSAYDSKEEAVDEDVVDGDRGGEAAAGRCWVLVELLCSHHAAAAMAAPPAEAAAEGEGEDDDDQDEDEDEDDENGSRAARRRRSQTPVVSAAWRQAVGRAAEAALEHVVYRSVGEVEAGEDAGCCEGVYGNLLRNLMDELAEGCRDGGAAASTGAHGLVGRLTRAQAAFLEALCHVAACVERASRGDGGEAHEDLGGAQPPLLPLQQRLCRHWLSTCRPEVAASSGLPPQALLKLLPLTAGPVRRAAAAAAAAAADGSRHSTSEDVLLASGLPDLSCAWARHCLSRPAVLLDRTGPAVTALELATACFPVPDAGCSGSSSSGGGARAAAAALALVRSGGAGLAASERPVLKQLVHHELVRHAGLAASRRQQLPQPPETAASSSSPVLGGRGAAMSPQGPQEQLAAHAVMIRLAHAAVVHDWRSLGQPEWHALLQALQDQMAETVAALTECLRQLAAAARAAADGVLQQASGTTPPGPMALQLLRKLAQRGVLERIPQGRQLEEAAGAALEACGIGPAARAAAQLAAVLMDLQDEMAAEVGGGTASGAAAAARAYSDTMQTCCSYAMQLAISLGGAECYGMAFGSGTSAAVTAWMTRHSDFWAAVTRCAGRALMPGREHLGSQAGVAAVAAQASVLSQAGLDAVSALLAVVLTPGSHLLQPVAYRLLLGNALLPDMTLAESAAAGSGGDPGADVELPEYDGDDVAFLSAGGIRPEMAPCLLPPSPTTAAATARCASGHGSSGGGSARVHLTAWALLLSHALDLDAGSRGLAVLRQVLREVEPLVHGFLDRLVWEMGLQRRQQLQQGEKQSSGARSGRVGGGGSITAEVAQASVTSAERWRLAEALREIGLPSGPHAVHATCRTLYRAVLRALPATARGWFGELRDRGLAASVESYTASAEGPALLATEIASVQALKRGGGDERFSVRASPSSREVVATMEVEDGAVLELVVKLPACLPLRAPEVECRRKVGVNETRLRKWLLSIATFLRHQNGSVADAIALWKRNVDSEFEGVEACLICYSVISSVNGQLPRLVCRTCNVRFHPACLYKWFKSAGKSQCPHCQALW